MYIAPLILHVYIIDYVQIAKGDEGYNWQDSPPTESSLDQV